MVRIEGDVSARDEELGWQLLAPTAADPAPLVRAHYPRALTLALQLGGDRAAAMEMADAAFAELLADPERYRERVPLPSLLDRLVATRSLRVEGQGDGPAAGVQTEQRAALYLREGAGLRYAEIAAALECTPSHVREWLLEARCGLQPGLEAHPELSAYHDDELEGPEREILRRRIEESEDLKAAHAELGRVAERVGRHLEERAREVVLDDADLEAAAERIAGAVADSRARRLGAARRRKTSSRMLVILLAVTVVGATVTLLRSRITDEPDAEELMGAVGRGLAGGYFELEVEAQGLIGSALEMLKAAGVDELISPESRLLVGPGGLSHVCVEVKNPADGATIELHAGFDGTNNWMWATGQPQVSTFNPASLESGREALDQLLVWRKTLDFVQDMLRKPERLTVLGRVRPREGEGEEQWWKLRAQGRMAGARATFWIDEDMRVRRIAFGGLQFELVPRDAGPGDFRIDRWTPPGLPLVEVDR